MRRLFGQRQHHHQELESPGTFKGGTIQFVDVAIEKAQRLELVIKSNRCHHNRVK
jgi:hypothetical protein